jgi:phosphopentomutase
MKFNRIGLIILDSLGVGALGDAAQYGDENTNTLANMAKAAGGISIPLLERLGIGHITDILGVSKVKNPAAYYTKAKEASIGKDTLTGHWEIMGIKTEKPFKTFNQDGFPPELMKKLEQDTGRRFIGNIAASGTKIINDLGMQHMKTGELIIYTSADSVMQIAAHEHIVDLQTLYSICEIAREITMCDEWKVGRVIARPFVGEPGHFTRTPNRHDYALKPPAKTVLNRLKENGYDVIGIGKINDIYALEGITKSYPSKSNDEGMGLLNMVVKTAFHGLAFINLVDFDMKYGHRRDYRGYGTRVASSFSSSR